MRRQQMKIGRADEAESIQRLYLDGHKQEAAARGPTQGTRRLAIPSTVITDYVKHLADAHRLDPAPFEAIGLSRPTSPQDTNGGIGSA